MNECIYEVYVPAFCDGDGDGRGDLQGIISRLDYLKSVGAGMLWLTPFYPTPGVDQGYDISNYRDVDPAYGTLAELERLIVCAHDRGMKIMIDVVLNHTSTEHPWFLQSVQEPTGPYGSYYIWYDNIPNNWQSFMSGSAWEYREERRQYYYHAFSTGQACLNWRNEAVRQEMLEVLHFWIDRGIDGFRFDVINFLKTDDYFFRNNPELCVNPKEGIKQNHCYDKNQPGSRVVVQELCRQLREWKKDIFLLGEVGEETAECYLPYVGPGLLDTCFYFNLGSIQRLNADVLAEAIGQSEQVPGPTTLFFSTHDMKRFFHRLCGYDRSLAELITILLWTARGIPVVYQGDESLLEDVEIASLEDIRDIQGIRAYRQARKEGLEEKKAFLKAKQETRDYSRGLIDWNRMIPTREWLMLMQLKKQHAALQKGQYGMVKSCKNMLFYNRTAEEEIIHVCLNFDDRKHRVTIADHADVLYGHIDGRQQLNAHEGIIWMEGFHEKSDNAKHSG